MKVFFTRRTQFTHAGRDWLNKIWPPLLIGVAALIFLLMGLSRFIEDKVADRREEMIYALSLRAASLAWAIEAILRGLGTGGISAGFSRMLVELSRQPGIAWLAVIKANGEIIADSNPELIGRMVYSPEELKEMAPSFLLQYRFSPDDPNVFETWKSFLPGRLKGKKRHENIETEIVSVGLNASNFHEELAGYEAQLKLFAFLGLSSILSVAILVFYIHNYRSSRHSLREAQALTGQIIDNYPEAMILCDYDGNIAIYNQSAKDILNLDGQEKLANIPGVPWERIFHELKQAKSVQDSEFTLRPNSAAPVAASISMNIIRNTSGQAIGYLVVCKDLSQIRLLQGKLAESRKLSAMGHLAAGVAHEIRNPLSAICGYAMYLKERLSGDALGQSTAELLEEEARRLDSALSDLLYIAKKPVLKMRRVQAGEIIRRVKTLILPDAEAKKIEIAVKEPEIIRPLVADEDRLLQVLLNLALNAIQAVPEKGKISLGAEFLADCPADLPLDMECSSGIWAIRIADNGKGLPKELLEEIFTPYFTTRAEGTGLGLAVARQIIEAHHGSIKVKSEVGKGTEFIIYLSSGDNDENKSQNSCH